MKVRPAWALLGLATASWAAVIILDALNEPGHIREYMLVLAGVSTLSLLNSLGGAERTSAITSLAKAAVTRPFYRDRTGPQPARHSGPNPLPPPAVVSLDGAGRPRPGRHATR